MSVHRMNGVEIKKCSGRTPTGMTPNESRLSCGALKKIPSLIYARRQLQALVRQLRQRTQVIN